MLRVFVSSVARNQTNATQTVRLAGFDSLLAYCIRSGRVRVRAGAPSKVTYPNNIRE